MKVRLLLVEDHTLFRQGLAKILIEHDMEVAQAATGHQALRQLAEQQPDVAVVDYELPDMSGPDLVRRLKQQKFDVPILILTIHQDPMRIHEAIDSGVQGYLPKSSELEELLAAIRALKSGEAYLHHAALRSEVRQLPSLTHRQCLILTYLGQGKTNAQIGHSLNVSASTVKYELRLLFSMLHCTDRTSLALLASRRGLVSPAQMSSSGDLSR